MADDDEPPFVFEFGFGGDGEDLPEPIRRMMEQGKTMSETMELASRQRRMQSELDIRHHEALIEVVRAEVEVAKAGIEVAEAELANTSLSGPQRKVLEAKKKSLTLLRDALEAQVARMDDLKEIKLEFAELALKEDPGAMGGVLNFFTNGEAGGPLGPPDGTISGKAEDPRFDPAPELKHKPKEKPDEPDGEQGAKD